MHFDVSRPFLRSIWLILTALGAFAFCGSDLHAQQTELSYYPRYDYYGSLSFPKGLSVGARIQPFSSLSFEGSLGTYILANSATFGFNIHPDRFHSEYDPAYSFLGTYLKTKGNDWMIFSVALSWLTLHKSGLNATYRGGLSAWVREMDPGSGKYRVLPLPYLEIGLSWSFPQLSY